MDILFTSSIWVWRAKAEIRDLAEADPELFEAAQHGDTAAMELRRRVRRQHSQESMHAGVPGGV